MKKRKWLKPELTILTRNKPEESVLSACKKSDSGSGANNAHSNCWQDIPNCYNACFTHDGS